MFTYYWVQRSYFSRHISVFWSNTLPLSVSVQVRPAPPKPPEKGFRSPANSPTAERERREEEPEVEEYGSHEPATKDPKPAPKSARLPDLSCSGAVALPKTRTT